MEIVYRFVPYGEPFEPAAGVLVLDVGMRMAPGVIDHHHPEAEPECAASLIAKHPGLVLDHLRGFADGPGAPLTVITHKLPDFDALASIFLALRLLEKGTMDEGMTRLAAYTKLADSASLPKTIDLAGTPYAVLRALFAGSKKSEDEINRDRLAEGQKFMRFIHDRAAAGRDILDDRRLFAGIDRYERAIRRVEEDHERYLEDLSRARIVRLRLPAANGKERRLVDGLIVVNPRSFLLKEWARRDRERPSLGAGYSFILTSFGDVRFILGVDPETGVNLKGLGALLNEREHAKREAEGRPPGKPWYEGNAPFFDYRIIDSPQDGTCLTRAEIADTVLAFGRE